MLVNRRARSLRSVMRGSVNPARRAALTVEVLVVARGCQRSSEHTQ